MDHETGPCVSIYMFLSGFFLSSGFLMSETLLHLNLNKDMEASRVVIGLLDSNALVNLFFFIKMCLLSVVFVNFPNFHLPQNNLTYFNQTKSIERNEI